MKLEVRFLDPKPIDLVNRWFDSYFDEAAGKGLAIPILKYRPCGNGMGAVLDRFHLTGLNAKQVRYAKDSLAKAVDQLGMFSMEVGVSVGRFGSRPRWVSASA